MINLKDKDYFLFDGAFGTYYSLLYGNDEPCELANLDKTERVVDIHRRYINAGAAAIKTNTFAANSVSLSCDSKMVGKVIEAGYKNAVDAANGMAEVFADIGPVPAAEDEAFEEYIEISDKFISLGAKNFLLETMSGIFVLEIVSHIKKHVPDSFVIVSFAVGQDGYTIDGESAADIFKAASESQADAFGFNCICGPAHLLGILKRLPKTEKMISIMPNSGYPSVSDGKAVYSDNPKYFAQKLAQIHAAGAKILGGCCGTTPEHIRETVKLLERHEFSIPVIRTNPVVMTSAPENAFKEKLMSGEKVVAVELDPPLDADFSHIAEAAPYLKDAGADAITLADSPLARPRADSVIISAKVQREVGIQTIPHLTCRDHNTIGLKSILLGGSIEGIRNILIVTGDPVPAIERSEVKGVFSANSYSLIKYVNSLNDDVFKGKEFFVGAALNVNVQNFKSELARAAKKEENGAEFFLTQPVYSDEAVENIRIAKENLGGKILAGIMPIASYKNALFLNNEVSGIHIPDEIIKRMENKSPEEVREISLGFSLELIEKLSFADGYYLITPLKKYQLVGELVKKYKKDGFKMIILGEKLNSSIPSTLEAINSKNDEQIISLCKKQEECGAHYLDINTALADDELEAMLYVLRLVQENTRCGIMIDSPNVEVVKEAIKHVKGRNIIINSITLDERHELIDTAKEYGAGLVALPLTEDGIPETPEERLENAKKLVEIVSAKGITLDNLYIDIIVEALAVNGEAGKRAVETARLIRNEFPEVHLTCGLSNISFGLPKRVNINTAFIPALMCAGVDSAIIDITGERTQDMIAASKALCGIDEYCMEYIERFR